MSNSCDACSGKGGSHVIATDTKYSELYLTMLKIGQAKVSTGLSFRDLTEELFKHGYDLSNGCVKLAVKHWFFNSFYHSPDDHNPCENADDLERHPDCRFIMKGESSLVLIEHETMQRSIRQSKVAINWAIVAIVVSLLAIDEVHDGIKNRAKGIGKMLSEQPINKTPIDTPSTPNQSDLKTSDTSLKDTPNRTTKIDTSSPS